jgi:hypothetical protein
MEFELLHGGDRPFRDSRQIAFARSWATAAPSARPA